MLKPKGIINGLFLSFLSALLTNGLLRNNFDCVKSIVSNVSMITATFTPKLYGGKLHKPNGIDFKVNLF